MSIIPSKLKTGDEIRIISPSSSMNILSDETITIAKNTLENLGFKVTISQYAKDVDDELYNTASIEKRVSDIHDAFKDKNVKAILTSIGGFNSNQILDYLDYDLIKDNPKILCGYSDITAILNAIYSRTGLITYYGPHFSTFGIKYNNEYTVKHFMKMNNQEEIEINPSNKWSNDLWFLDQENRTLIDNDGYKVISKGTSEGTIIGGNLCTLNLLQGTPYFPKNKDVILFIEDDGGAQENYLKEFDRNLVSLIQTIGVNNIKGIVVGRAEIVSKMDYDKWKLIFKNKKINIPIVVDVDFGHTNPMITFPIGGYAYLDITDKIMIKIK